ncbi:glycosyltransferase [Ruminiclostridium papyrosolvens]|uniref:Glycosyl transferase family 2 n=1 Tax=Ruminiclostridium papyrosolvens C7 TaxID=1330534 RepID=U4R389_9FIRM|nr:glycosyltransferase [Ruminiclostridium papyrosolvens]EPR12074.1 glycosyl transferase family 2 [Ruminiclostridium papyrosolvens C7]
MKNEFIYSSDTSSLPFVSVIIPAYNAEKYLEKCLNCITNQNYPKEKMEIIVVDNNSTDNTAEIIKSFGVTYVFNAKKGPSPSRNKGISLAAGEYLIFTDSDCLADSDFVLNHVKAHLDLQKSNPKVKMVGGGIGGYNKNFWAVCDDFCSWSAYHPALKPQINNSYFPSANISISRSLVDEIGVFNEDLKTGEDVDFCLRVTYRGYRLYFEPKAKVLHINRDTFSEFMGHGKSWAKPVASPERENSQQHKRPEGLKNSLPVYAKNYIKSILEVISYGFKAKRFYVIIFIPFIILYKTYFAYHRMLFRMEAARKQIGK